MDSWHLVENAVNSCGGDIANIPSVGMAALNYLSVGMSNHWQLPAHASHTLWVYLSDWNAFHPHFVHCVISVLKTALSTKGA